MDIPSLYREKFSTSGFLDEYYTFEKMDGRIKHQLVFFHESLKKIPNDVEVLDYGAGPSILSTISAATKSQRIVLAEHTEDNRKALSKWLTGDHGSFDWDKHIAYVIKDLEGKDDEEIDERKSRIRKSVEAVVTCDVTANLLIDPKYDKQYDVVITSLVAEAVATNLEEVKLYLKRITSFVKPSGTLLYYGVENQVGNYIVNNEIFPYAYASTHFIMSSLKEFGFINLSLGEFKPNNDPNRVFRWIYGIKSELFY